MSLKPHARAEDDRLNLEDLREIEAALIEARQALTRAMTGLGGGREQFVRGVGFALGRLMRIQARIYREAQEEEPPMATTVRLAPFVCPRCGARSFNPNDIAQRYCGRRHAFVEEAPDAP